MRCMSIQDELRELLSTHFIDRQLCPTIWETGQQTSACVSLSFLNVRAGDPLVVSIRPGMGTTLFKCG